MELPHQFRDALTTKFNIEELQTIAFDLRLDWDSLPGAAKPGKVIALLRTVARQNLWERLHGRLVETQPTISWPSPAALAAFDWAGTLPPTPTTATTINSDIDQGSAIGGAVNSGGGDVVGHDKFEATNSGDQNVVLQGSRNQNAADGGVNIGGDHFGDVIIGDQQRPSTPKATYRIAPPNPRHELLGRDADIDWLKKRLRGEGSAALAGVRGIGGIGKTELALRVVRELEDEFEGRVMWLTCGDKPIFSIQSELGLALGVDLEPAGESEAARANLLRAALEQAPRTLIIYDDVRRAQQGAFQSVLDVPRPPHALLVTSRLANLLPFDRVRRLDVLDDGAAGTLLRRESGIEPADSAAKESKENMEAQAAAEIIVLLEAIPLAIILVGRQMARAQRRRRPPATPYQAMLGQLREKRAAILAKESSESQISLRVSFELSYAELEGADQERVRALGIFGLNSFTYSGLPTALGGRGRAGRSGAGPDRGGRPDRSGRRRGVVDARRAARLRGRGAKSGRRVGDGRNPAGPTCGSTAKPYQSCARSPTTSGWLRSGRRSSERPDGWKRAGRSTRPWQPTWRSRWGTPFTPKMIPAS